MKNDGHKLGIINRFHRTLKEKWITYFINIDTVKWVNEIDDIIYNYDHSVNCNTGFTINTIIIIINNIIYCVNPFYCIIIYKIIYSFFF